MRKKLYRQMDAEVWEGSGISPINILVLVLVLLSILVAIFQSEQSIVNAYPWVFKSFNWLFAVIFTIEYGIRIIVMGENPKYSGVGGRVRYARTFTSLLDLTATSAIWIDLAFGVPGIYGVVLRLARVLRVFTLTRNSKVGIAIRLLRDSIAARAMELTLAFVLAVVALLVASVLLFVVEGSTQPEAFGSIPRAMWWAIATLATVGYGDVVPVTVAGRILAGITALTAIGLVAMPAGIMAAAFSNAFQELRQNDQASIVA